MYVIALFALGLMACSVVMIANPDMWSRAIVAFSHKPWFHPVEILTRISFGAGFVLAADQTQYPNFFATAGYLLCAVGLGLLLIGPARHRTFAQWSAKAFNRTFRPAGVGSLFAGAWLAYAAMV